MTALDIPAVRAAFDAQIRRNADAGEPGAAVEADDGVLRWVAPGTQTSCILWSSLTGATADQVIAAQKQYFARRGTAVEWKYYDYDQPADLPARLLAAGFEPDDEELMLVAETASIDSRVVLPDGVRLVPVADEAGIGTMMAVHDLAFTDHPSSELGERLLTQFREAPETLEMVVAMAGGEPVSAARIEFIPGTDFAGLWGGGTIPAWRGQGIFRALVAYRAGLAAHDQPADPAAPRVRAGGEYHAVYLHAARRDAGRIGVATEPAGAASARADTMYPW